MPTISEVLHEATEILHRSGIVEPRREANSLLAFALEKDKTFFIAHSDHRLSEQEQADFRKILARRARHEPFQQITGRQEFYGLDFIVTPDVLIPRPETELIVENAVEILRQRKAARFCEVGAGSGCISISILHEIKDASAIGLDISEKALAIAKKNAERHGVLPRLELKISDVFAALKNGQFDLIVSNPPYVPLEDVETLQQEVRDYEPIIALTDGASGLSIVEQIVVESPRFLKSDGFLLMEIGFNQAEKVRPMFDRRLWRELEILPDLQGIPRMVRARAGN